MAAAGRRGLQADFGGEQLGRGACYLIDRLTHREKAGGGGGRPLMKGGGEGFSHHLSPCQPAARGPWEPGSVLHPPPPYPYPPPLHTYKPYPSITSCGIFKFDLPIFPPQIYFDFDIKFCACQHDTHYIPVIFWLW